MKLACRHRRIYLNRRRTKYCTVLLFPSTGALRVWYARHRPYEKATDTVGVHCAHVRRRYKGKAFLLPETGRVGLSVNECGAGIVAHELMHAIIWARLHPRLDDDNVPRLVIRSMRQEENILHDLSDAISEFYRWYWTVAEPA